jgi:hypothetical protein
MFRSGLRKLTMIAAAAAALSAIACGSTPPTAPIILPTTLTVTSVTPVVGGINGGTTITITGTAFGSDTTVTVGDQKATSVTVLGPTSLTAVTPAHAAGVGAIIVASGSSSVASPTSFTFVAPTGSNLPPVVTGITSTGPRAFQPSGFGDIGETVSLIATVTDVETPVSALTFAWSVPQGTITGTGANATWVLPATLAGTPTTVTATVTVTESYTEAGIAQRNVTTATFPMSVHNSQKEILDMGQDFLELFSQSQYTPDQVLHNFSVLCDGGGGHDSEKSDVEANRTYFRQEAGWSVDRVPPVTFNFDGICDESSFTPSRLRRADACSRFSVHWIDTRIAFDPRFPNEKVGDHGETRGIDYVTAVLESDRWKLCHSDYNENEPPSLVSGFAKYLLWKHGGGLWPLSAGAIK